MFWRTIVSGCWVREIYDCIHVCPVDENKIKILKVGNEWLIKFGQFNTNANNCYFYMPINSLLTGVIIAISYIEVFFYFKMLSSYQFYILSLFAIEIIYHLMYLTPHGNNGFGIYVILDEICYRILSILSVLCTSLWQYKQ